MIEYYEMLFDMYNQYMPENSQYSPKIVKYYTNTSTDFPTISFILNDSTNSDDTTVDKTEYYDNYYFTIDIYTKDAKKENKKIASQIINDELTNLTNKFFQYYNMKRTLCQYIPNLDDKILRRTLRFQCQINNRGNIIRR